MRQPTRLFFVAVFVSGLLLQIAALPLRGTPDVQIFEEWTVSSLSYGLFSAYGPPDPRPSDYVRPDYPPISVALLAGVGAAVELAGGDITSDSRVLPFAIKLMTLTMHFAAFALLLRHGRAWTGDESAARLLALAYWINPALIVNGAVLGYLDPVCVLPGLCAVVAASSRRFGLAAALAVAAALVKPQGLFFLLPVASAAWGSWRSAFTAATAGAATFAVVISPFPIVGGLRGFLGAMSAVVREDLLSGNALNVWWLFTSSAMSLEHASKVFSIPLEAMKESQFVMATGVEPRLWMAVTVIGFAGWVGWLMRGQTRAVALAAYLALVIHVYVVLAISVHENHQVYMVAPLLLVASAEPSYRRLAALVSLLVASNMVVFYGLGRDLPEPSRTGLFIVVTVMLSISNILLLAVHGRLFRDFYTRMRTPLTF